MTVRRLRAKQRGPRCSYCDQRASYRGCHFTVFACLDHFAALQGRDQEAAQRDAYQSEAEWSMGL